MAEHGVAEEAEVVEGCCGFGEEGDHVCDDG